ncbi:alpha/beta fold hydrolase [Stackebrandtia soli]|uniref:alpha/beta hydrolase n=1 Tax=Stackebrandtia soli TaxID=1892856 RepID=UPI0039EA0A07
MKTLDIPVPGGTLRALRFGDGPKVILAAHGITASAMSFSAVARHLPESFQLVAVDLRGRGGSADQPGPYGMDTHAGDLNAVAEHLGAPVVLTGQSMGAYAALRAAAARPELYSRLVLIDGGLPLPVPAGVDPDAIVAATVGPAVARLSETYPSEDAYLEFFRAHPALGPDWNEDMAAYVRYDVSEVGDGAVRSRVNPAAVTADGRDLVVGSEAIQRDIATLTVPTTLLYAPKGMLGAAPGLLPQALVDHWAAQGTFTARLVEDTNHYTILMTPGPAAVIAETLTA